MVSRELAKLVEELSQQIEEAKVEYQSSDRNEEWTKTSLIIPLLEGLGWDRGRDISYEDSPRDVEDRLDYILKGHHPIGIEAKALDVPSPQDYGHPHIKKGLRQSKERGASYFIWTNGDCWQFSSMALEKAPIYQVMLSSARGGAGQVESVVNKLHIIQKERFNANPEIFDEAICNNWKTAALPDAWGVLIKQHMNDLLQLFQKCLPAELNIKNEEILAFVGTLKTPDIAAEHPRKKYSAPDRIRSFPDDWKQLLESFDPDYDRARKRFRRDLYRKLGQYLISEKYKPWSKLATWRHVGISDDAGERKKLGPVVALFIGWGFIKSEQGTDKYKRVDESIEYLKKLLD